MIFLIRAVRMDGSFLLEKIMRFYANECETMLITGCFICDRLWVNEKHILSDDIKQGLRVLRYHR